MAATNANPDTSSSSPQDDLLKKVPPGTILPPRGKRDTIEKVAAYVARNGKAFEEKLKANPTITWVYPSDPFHDYYLWRIDEVKAGRGFDENSKNIARSSKTEVTFAGREAPKPPAEWHFSARMPNISAQDLEVVKLTALYAAKNGRSWVTQLSQRESGNYQFDFLRPQHSLNMYFNRIVEQYKDLLEGETAEGGGPQRKRMAELQQNVHNRFSVLERARKRAEYAKHLDRQKVEKEEKVEREKIAFAQIDWHDFNLVATILFDESDEQAEMPPPRSLHDMLALSLEEKAKMRIDPNRRLEEAVPTFDDHEMIYGHPAMMPAAQLSPMPPPPPPQQGYPVQAPGSGSASGSPAQPSPYAPPIAPSLQEERDRARALAKTAPSQQARVRTDYVPQAQARNKMHNTSICPNCKQPIPNDEMEHHLRIEMLSPEWREQMAKNQQRSATTNLSTADVANNLKRLASQRTDLFDPVTGQALSDEEHARRKRAEMQAYDGVSQVPNAAALGAMGQRPPGTTSLGADVQQQIRSLHERYKK